MNRPVRLPTLSALLDAAVRRLLEITSTSTLSAEESEVAAGLTKAGIS